MEFDFNLSGVSDIRIETDVIKEYELIDGKMQKKEKEKKGAMLRRYVDGKWICESIDSDDYEIINSILKQKVGSNGQEEFRQSGNIYETNNDIIIKIAEKPSDRDIQEILRSFFEVNESYISKSSNYDIRFIEQIVEKEYHSSWKSEVIQKTIHFGIIIDIEFKIRDNTFFDEFNVCVENYKLLKKELDNSYRFIKQLYQYSLEADELSSGEYDILLHPRVSGIFTHECIGHLAEADMNEEYIRKLFKENYMINTRLSINVVDSGKVGVSGRLAYDDEGILKKDTYIVKDSRLNQELTTLSEAIDMKCMCSTGNARAVDYSHEPIPRMTTTYIESGNCKKEDMFRQIKNGIYIKTVKQCSGHFYYSIIPNVAYEIKDGKILRPVIAPKISGRSIKLFSNIVALSNEIEIYDFIKIGCGKKNQNNLPVSFGGPYVLIKEMPLGY